MRLGTWITGSLVLCSLLGGVPAQAAPRYTCGESDLLFGCTKTEEKARLRAGCGVHAEGRFFASAWRTYDLQTDEVLTTAAAGPDGIALVELPQRRWFVIEGELSCTDDSGGHAIPYRFLVERTGAHSFAQRHYTPEALVATGNWNPDTQLHYGAFRSRSLTGSRAGGGRNAPASPR